MIHINSIAESINQINNYANFSYIEINKHAFSFYLHKSIQINLKVQLIFKSYVWKTTNLNFIIVTLYTVSIYKKKEDILIQIEIKF